MAEQTAPMEANSKTGKETRPIRYRRVVRRGLRAVSTLLLRDAANIVARVVTLQLWFELRPMRLARRLMYSEQDLSNCRNRLRSGRGLYVLVGCMALRTAADRRVVSCLPGEVLHPNY